jgi:V8-like Glu-specific endopeptidase
MATLALAGMASTGAALAQSAQASTWSDADILSAKPKMPLVSNLPASVFDLNAAVQSDRESLAQPGVPGRKGNTDATALMQTRIYSPSLMNLLPFAATDSAAITPDAVGTEGMQFTSSRHYPRQIDKTYPNSAFGVLYFRDGPITYRCSASLIRPSVVITAGHCVHSGSGGNAGKYTDFEFIPGYSRVGNKETRPFGTWTNPVFAEAAPSWRTGGGTVPNVADFALLVMNRNAQGKRVGDFTGWLGYKLNSMIGKHVTSNGYPCNLDQCGIAHRVDSMVTNAGTNNGAYGSDMGGGSSGGPVVLNFRQDYTNSEAGAMDNEGRMVTGVVSWGYVSPRPKVQGSAVLNGEFTTLLNQACAGRPWAC